MGPEFVAALKPSPLPEPYWVAHNTKLGQSLGLPEGWQQSEPFLTALTGNGLLPGSAMHAGVYSGHQFGVWAGQLGDGRACLLGDLAGQEIQLKGAGPTPFSRRGDGRAVLRSAIREFLCSEAMHGLGIPTTRALCVTGSDATIWRETAETAAVVVRVAPSFIRFGHFEHFSKREQIPQLQALADFVIDNYYPTCRDGADANPYLAIAGTLVAGYLGMKQKLDPTDPYPGNAYQEEITVARPLEEALRTIDQEDAVVEILGEHFIRAYRSVKLTEYEAFNRTISSWEREHLLLNV